jgi:hypothetical protein
MLQAWIDFEPLAGFWSTNDAMYHTYIWFYMFQLKLLGRRVSDSHAQYPELTTKRAGQQSVSVTILMIFQTRSYRCEWQQKLVPAAAGDSLSFMLWLRAIVAVFVWEYCMCSQSFRSLLRAYNIWHSVLHRKHTNFYMVDFEPLRHFWRIMA